VRSSQFKMNRGRTLTKLTLNWTYLVKWINSYALRRSNVQTDVTSRICCRKRRTWWTMRKLLTIVWTRIFNFHWRKLSWIQKNSRNELLSINAKANTFSFKRWAHIRSNQALFRVSKIKWNFNSRYSVKSLLLCWIAQHQSKQRTFTLKTVWS